MTRDLFRAGDLILRRATSELPPGQREIASHPRYATAHPVVYALSYLGAVRTRRR